jgi:uncharacterized membrane protein
MFKFFKKQDDKIIRSNQWTFGVMLVFALFALTAAFVLSVEKIHVLQDPTAQLSCSINLVVDCSKVMQTWQSHVFGFPNMFIGLMAYAMIVVIAILGISQTKFPRWFLRAANAGYLLGAIFAYWLLFQSVYVIEILCPWCLLVTFSTTMILASMTHYNLRENTFGFSKKLNKNIQWFLSKDYDKLAVASWIVIIIALVITKFGAALFA